MLEGDIVQYVAWATQIVPLSDVRDIALGYVIGEAMARHSVWFVLIGNHKRTAKDMDELMAVFKERLPEIVNKIDKELGEEQEIEESKEVEE